MKKFVIPLVLMILAIVACKKDEKKSENVLQKSYFTIENGTYMDGNIPTPSGGNSPVIDDLFGNTSVLEGGSNPVSISTGNDVKEILVGVQGKNGYYKVTPAKLKSASHAYLVYLLFSSEFEQNSFTIVFCIVDQGGLVSQYQTIEVSRIEAGTGKLQVSCSWDKANDIDLHLFEPDGNQIDWEYDRSASGGWLDVDSNPICIIDNINNENITYSGDAKIQGGKYQVKIALFSSCEVVDPTNIVVTARLNGKLVTPTSGKNPYYGSVPASQSYIDADGPEDGVLVMEFSTSALKSSDIEKVKMLKFTFPAKANEAKRAMLRN